MRNPPVFCGDPKMMRHVSVLAAQACGVGTAVGCVLIDANGVVTGEGYNRTVLPPDAMTAAAMGPDQRRYVIHAEIVAMLSARSRAIVAYTTIAPCFDCLKTLYVYGVRRVAYHRCLGSNKIVSEETLALFTTFLSATGIAVTDFHGRPFLDDLHETKAQ